MNKIEQIKSIKNGNGIQYLLDEAHRIFRNPITMFDLSYTLKFYTAVTTDDPLWNELISTGTFSLETQEFFANECFTEAVVNADKLAILKSNKLQYDRILGNIHNGDGIKVTNIVMVFCETPLQEDDTIAFEALVDKITDEIKNDDYYITYGKESIEKIIINLLNKTTYKPVIHSAHIQILYDGFEAYLYAVVVDVMQNSIYQNKPADLKRLLESIFPFYKYAIYSDYIVMLVSSKYNTLSDELLLTKLDQSLRQNGLFAGISSSFENFFELREHYDQAVSALKKGMESNNDQRVFIFKP